MTVDSETQHRQTEICTLNNKNIKKFILLIKKVITESGYAGICTSAHLKSAH